MKKIISIIFVIFFFSPFLWRGAGGEAFAQLNRANKYYDNYDYVKAIQLYKKALNKKDSSEVFEKIANSYRLIKNYPQAETYYALLMKLNNSQESSQKMNPLNYFYYGMVLKNNNKIDEAKAQFKLYSSAVPNDEKAELSVKSCDDIKIWISKTQQFDISPIAIINTVHSEFCPAFYKQEMLFVSDQSQDLVNNSQYSWNKQPYLNVYSSKVKTDTNGTITFSKKIKPFPFPINSEFHDGPVCFNAEQNMMFITRVDYKENKKDKDFVNRPQLYISTLNGKSWSKVKPFQYNNDSYSMAHSSISADGQWLFFASDMPGGQGGMDIYVCKKEGENWGEPQNLGSEVNTSGTEGFPYIRKDGVIYFSSDGHGGFGGLDVFSATKINDRYSDVKNLGAPLNSSTDDFGIIFSDDNTKGYFSSDRTSGKGSDDIYSFVALNKFIAISGKILFSQNVSDPARNAKVMLLTEDGKIINLSTTDSTGFFKFDKLDPDTKYLVKLDETDPAIAARKKYYMADDKDKIVRVTVINDKGGKFVFQNLPMDSNSMSEIALGDDITIAGNLLFGENPSKALANTKVNLVNEKGEIIQTTTTNASGGFVFTDLPADENYLVKVDENDTKLAANMKISITNKNGKVIQSTKSGNKGEFKFSFLAADSHTLAEIGEADDVTIAGNLLFGGNPSKPLANTKVNLVNEKGEIVQTVTTNAFGAFVFTNLPPDKNFLVKVDERDTELAPNTKIIITNKNGKEMQTTTSGSKGEFNFSFLAADRNTLKSMTIEDSDLKFALKGKIVSENKSPLANAIVNLINEKGEIIQTARTDKKGNFHFTNLPADQTFLFALDESDTKLSTYNKLYLTNEKGGVLKEFIRTNGKFRFTILPSDQKTMGALYVDDPWLKVLQFKNEHWKDSLIIVENIYYEYGWFKILPEAGKTLDKVVNIMKNDPQLVIKLSSHTDSRSSADFNLRLFRQRAKAAVDYIVSKGIAKDRISGRGYGETKLINHCADGIGCSEEEHAKNRRTEFVILRKQKH